MKLKALIVSFFAVFSVLLAGQLDLDVFKANSDGSVIKIEWQKNDESLITRYQLERSSEGKPFKIIKEFESQGSNFLYQYIDENPYMKPKEAIEKDANTISSEYEYSYRLKVYFTNNSYKYSDQINVTHKTSSIRRTWGMIKEMFK